MTRLILSERSKKAILSLPQNNLYPILSTSDPLIALRELYKNNIKNFYSTRDELILRGINFDTGYKNNIFPFLDYSDSPKIIVTSQNDYYKKIDFSLLNIPDFIERFKVSSDFFFDEIPLQGFTVLSKNVSTEYVSNIFMQAGFVTSEFPLKDSSILIEEKETPKISEFFSKQEFLSFHKFCLDNNYSRLSDLSIEKINRFIDHPQVGTKKVQKVIDKYKSYLERTPATAIETVINENLEFYFKNDFKKICEKYSINFAELIDELYSGDNYFDYSTMDSLVELSLKKFINDRIEMAKGNYVNTIYNQYITQSYSSYLNDMQLSTLKIMLAKKKVKTFWPIISDDASFLADIPLNIDTIKVFEDLITFQQSLPSLTSTISDIKKQLKNRDLNCLFLRYIQEQTLQNIAEQTGITRERVRQLVKKTESKIMKLTNLTDLSILLDIISNQSIGLTKKNLMSFFCIESEEDYVVFQVMMKASQKYSFHTTLEIYTTKEQIKYIDEKIVEMDFLSPILTMDEVKMHFRINDMAEKEDTEFTDRIQHLLHLKGYMNPGEVYFKKSVSLKEKFSFIFKHYISSPLKMNEVGFARLSFLMKKVFGLELADNQRSVTERIRQADNIILVDPLTFSPFDATALDEGFISEIKIYIKKKLQDKEWMNIKEVYEDNLELMQRNQINSKIFLYSLVQFYLNDDFDIGKGNTLNIYRSNSIKHNSEEVLEKLLKSNNQKMNKKRALEVLHWPPYKLDQLIGESPKFISFNNNEFALFSSLKVSIKDKTKMIDFFKKEMFGGFSFSYDIYQEMQFDEEMSFILKKYRINNYFELVQIVKKLTSNIKGYSNFIYLEDSPINSLEKFLIKRFPEYTSRKEIYEFVLSKGYSEQTGQVTLRDLLTNRIFIDIDGNKMANRKSLSFNYDLQEALREYLEKEFGEEPFISVYNLIGFKSKLPPLKTGHWTKHLIYNLGIELGYKAIKSTSDYRYDKLILIKPNSPFNKYDELIHYVLKNKYNGPLYELEVAQYLANSGLAHNKEKLAFELKISPLLSLDDFGWITLNQEVK